MAFQFPFDERAAAHGAAVGGVADGRAFFHGDIVPCYPRRVTETSVVRIGPYLLNVTATERGICTIEISKQPFRKAKKPNTFLEQLSAAAERFEAGDAHAFDALPLDVHGTEFQRKVWKAARGIPFGETRTYGEIAQMVGSPMAVRAVGTALGKNPVCVVVPCHRVVPSGGGIGQYAYGQRMKRWLLDHEAKAA
jgi:methylated-DNA-[protein]-cysteine S-methyltransferase